MTLRDLNDAQRYALQILAEQPGPGDWTWPAGVDCWYGSFEALVRRGLAERQKHERLGVNVYRILPAARAAWERLSEEDS